MGWDSNFNIRWLRVLGNSAQDLTTVLPAGATGVLGLAVGVHSAGLYIDDGSADGVIGIASVIASSVVNPLWLPRPFPLVMVTSDGGSHNVYALGLDATADYTVYYTTTGGFGPANT